MKKRQRKLKTPDLEGVDLGVAWYSASEWERLKEVVPDPDKLETTYGEWESMARAALADLEAAGLTPKRVPVGAEELLAWCEEVGCEPDSSARAQFAAEKLRQGEQGEPGKS